MFDGATPENVSELIRWTKFNARINVVTLIAVVVQMILGVLMFPAMIYLLLKIRESLIQSRQLTQLSQIQAEKTEQGVNKLTAVADVAAEKAEKIATVASEVAKKIDGASNDALSESQRIPVVKAQPPSGA